MQPRIRWSFPLRLILVQVASMNSSKCGRSTMWGVALEVYVCKEGITLEGNLSSGSRGGGV